MRGTTVQTTQLKTTQLGRTGLEITRVGFGAWAIGGGGWEFGWGPQDDNQSIAAMNRALELGVNWIDTAPVYGLGHSEEVVGRLPEGSQVAGEAVSGEWVRVTYRGVSGWVHSSLLQ